MLSTEKAYNLDIRDYKEIGRELKTAIDKAVKDTQSVIHRAYPNKLIMTTEQYKMLTRSKAFWGQQYEGQQFYLYRSPYNIMEVEVIGNEKPIITIGDDV